MCTARSVKASHHVCCLAHDDVCEIRVSPDGGESDAALAPGIGRIEIFNIPLPLPELGLFLKRGGTSCEKAYHQDQQGRTCSLAPGQAQHYQTAMLCRLLPEQESICLARVYWQAIKVEAMAQAAAGAHGSSG